MKKSLTLLKKSLRGEGIKPLEDLTKTRHKNASPFKSNPNIEIPEHDEQNADES